MSTEKTKKPTGLTITRSGENFTLKWKIGDTDYGNGQKLRYRSKGSSWSGWTTLTKSTNPKITSTQTSFTKNFSLANLKAVEIQVCGNQKKYTKKGKTINPAWSDWASKTWTAAVPAAPSLSYENSTANSGVFTWSAPNPADTPAVLLRVEAQTCFVRNTSAPPANAWGAVMTKSASGSQTVTEETEHLAAGNLVRWYRVRSVGPAGASGWVMASHAYGAPVAATIVSASADTKGTVTQITAVWKDAYNSLMPIDKIMLQYAIAIPTDTAMTAPASGWSDAIEVTPNGANNTIVVNVGDTIDDDECVWVRVKSSHDGVESYSGAMLAQTGKLAAPTINAVPSLTTGSVSISITEATSCTAACTAIFYRAEDNPSTDQIVAILPRGTTSATLTVPDIIGKTTTCFGAYAFVGAYTDLTISEIRMRSDIATDTDIAAEAPAFISVVDGPKEGSVRINWDWTWREAVKAELTWALFEDAWESTERPNSFIMDERFVTSWIIAGLETGKRWFFRVRLISENDDNATNGPWSAIAAFDLKSTPDRPVLLLSKSVINEGESVTARWASSITDGAEQAFAEICLVTYENGEPVYDDVVAHVEAAHSVEIKREWETGETYMMAVRTTSTAGVQSIWSDPVTLFVAEPLEAEITYTNLTPVVVDQETVYTLLTLPLVVTVTGAGTAGETAVSVVRAEDYHFERPDGKNYDGFAGETIATYSQTGENTITITIDDLVGRLDDGAKYTIVATVTGIYGQSDTSTLTFTVDWSHKAGVPSASVVTDKVNRITIITPIAPENYAAGDVCDIYRLTIDTPELIFSGADFGEAYVDPYPGFGEACGHRIVTRTANGDYATDDGIGWYDTNIDDGDYLEELNMIIDVDGAQIVLPYNLSLTNKWTKDFQRTTYLGGAVQGDWNPAVTRDMTANTVIVRGDDLDTQIIMHDLAGFAGVAHIRTPDGSSLTADIQISETQEYKTDKISYSLTIQAIDPEEPAGMTLEEWEASQPEV